LTPTGHKQLKFAVLHNAAFPSIGKVGVGSLIYINLRLAKPPILDQREGRRRILQPGTRTMRRIKAAFKDTKNLSRYLRGLGCTEAQIERHIVLKGRYKPGCLESTSTPRVPHYPASQVVFAAKWAN